MMKLGVMYIIDSSSCSSFFVTSYTPVGDRDGKRIIILSRLCTIVKCAPNPVDMLNQYEPM